MSLASQLAATPKSWELRAAADRSEPHWKLIADLMPHFVWAFSPDGSVSYVNRWAKEYAGLSARPIRAWDWLALLHEHDAAAACRAWGESIRTATAYEMDYRIRRADGEYRWHTCRGGPIRDTGGEPVLWLGTATDVHLNMAPARLVVEPKARVDQLTERERQVLECVSEGLSNRGVAERLGVSTNTVRNHVQRILYKLDVHSKLEAIATTNAKEVLRDFSRRLA